MAEGRGREERIRRWGSRTEAARGVLGFGQGPPCPNGSNTRGGAANRLLLKDRCRHEIPGDLRGSRRLYAGRRYGRRRGLSMEKESCWV